jgi:putative tryptophan/tyrosine transport system substrate-binding protein
MNRRSLLTLIGGAAVLPVAARAQQPALPVIGFLNSGPSGAPTTTSGLIAFRQSLADTGYVEGRSVAIEYRWAEGSVQIGLGADFHHMNL